MLSSLAPFVAPGGRLVYSTCSLEPEETTEVLAAWQSQEERFVPDDLPGWTAPFAAGQGVAVARPEVHGGDGFFVAVFRRG